METKTKNIIGEIMLIIPFIIMVIAIFVLFATIAWYLPLVIIGIIIWIAIGQKLTDN